MTLDKTSQASSSAIEIARETADRLLGQIESLSELPDSLDSQNTIARSLGADSLSVLLENDRDHPLVKWIRSSDDATTLSLLVDARSSEREGTSGLPQETEPVGGTEPDGGTLPPVVNGTVRCSGCGAILMVFEKQCNNPACLEENIYADFSESDVERLNSVPSSGSAPQDEQQILLRELLRNSGVAPEKIERATVRYQGMLKQKEEKGGFPYVKGALILIVLYWFYVGMPDTSAVFGGDADCRGLIEKKLDSLASFAPQEFGFSDKKLSVGHIVKQGSSLKDGQRVVSYSIRKEANGEDFVGSFVCLVGKGMVSIPGPLGQLKYQ